MSKRGFTLVEVLLAIVVISLALVSLLAANSVFTQNNAAGTNLSTAEFLVEQIRELTAPLAVTDPNAIGTPVFGAEEASLLLYDDLDDFDGKTFSPPINADRQPLNDLAGFSQQVTVQNVSAADFELVVADLGSSFVRVTVTVYLNSKKISSASWVRAIY
jgi:prepilin-type N-terminal cleavage/methylation domain-containing protein